MITNRKLILSIGIAFVLTMFLESSHPGVAAASEATAVQESSENTINFKGHIVMLIINNSSSIEVKRRTEYLVDPVLTKIGDRWFIRGHGYSPEGSNHWDKDIDIGVEWNTVDVFYSFTPKQMKEMEERRDEDE